MPRARDDRAAALRYRAPVPSRSASLPRFGTAHPAQVVVAAFAAAVAVSTALLMLPVSRAGDGSAPFLVAVFTATSAVCVTGLSVVDTPSYWSGFGEAVILGSIQVGGLGIMTLASLLGLLVARRLGLRARLTAAAETKAAGIGEVRTVVRGVVVISVLCEALTAVALFLRFRSGYDESVGDAAYLAVFHAVSAFNNAGFALYPDNLIGYVDDPLVYLPIALAVIAGGLGFPVWLELYRRYRFPRRWSLTTAITLGGTVVLLVLGTLFFALTEWRNPETLGALPPAHRVGVSFFHSVMPRTAGFNSIDYADVEPETLFGTIVLMFIGGGSAGTAGGIKVTTFVLLFFAIASEVRGEPDVNVLGRRIDDRAVRQALTVALLGVGAVMTSTVVLLSITDLPSDAVFFEATSAFATVGLSTGITADLPAGGQAVLVALMFLGRLGPITLVSALALRAHPRLYHLPKGRPLIG